jgi:ribose-phosphate pyrophosphokinase
MSAGLAIKIVEAQRFLPPVKQKAKAQPKNFNLVTMPSARELGQGIARWLGVRPLPVDFNTFGNGESYHRLGADPLKKPTFVVWSPRHTEALLHRDIFEALNLGRTLSDCRVELHGIFPHIPYLPQDRHDKSGACLSAATMIDLIKNAGYQQIVTLDMHTASLETAFAVAKLWPRHFSASPIFAQFLRSLTGGRLSPRNMKVLGLVPSEREPRNEDEIMMQPLDPADYICASPDLGGQQRAFETAKQLVGPAEADARMAVAIKHRNVDSGIVSLSRVIGPDLKGKTVVVVDDLLRSAFTAEIAVGAFKKAGAEKVLVFIPHPEMNDGAPERCEAMFRHGWIDLLVVTNSIEIPEKKRFRNLTQILLDPFLAAIIKAEANGRSINQAFYNVLQNTSLQVVRYE